MNAINLESICKAELVKSGKNERGSWELLVTRDERGHCEIAVFPNNIPSGVTEGGSFRLERITGVSHGNRQGSDGKWYPNISVRADVVPVCGIDEHMEKSEDGQWKELEDTEQLPF